MSLGSFNLGGLDSKMKKVLENLFGTWLPASTMTMLNKTFTSPAVTGLTGTLASPVITTPTITGPGISDPVITGEITSDELQSVEHGAGAISTAFAPKTYRRTENGVIITTIKFDMTGLGCKGTAANDVIGLPTGGAAFLGRYVAATYGIVFRVELKCIEVAAGSGSATLDIDVSGNLAADLAYDSAGGEAGDIFNTGAMVAGQELANITPALTPNDYIYLQEADTAATNGVYTAGQFILTFYGHPLMT